MGKRFWLRRLRLISADKKNTPVGFPMRFRPDNSSINSRCCRCFTCRSTTRRRISTGSWNGALRRSLNTIQIFFVDHLHFLIDMARVSNPSLEIGAIVRRIKRFAVDNDFIIFLLCHVKKTEGDDISWRDLRDSSFIAQDSDTCIMVKRTPKNGMASAKARVEFHRRTGMMEFVVELEKRNGLLYEVANNE